MLCHTMTDTTRVTELSETDLQKKNIFQNACDKDGLNWDYASSMWATEPVTPGFSEPLIMPPIIINKTVQTLHC